MELEQYLAEVKALIGGDIHEEEYVLGSAPRVLAAYRGHSVKVDFITTSELVLEVNKRPPFHLRIRKEGFVSRALEATGIAGDAKTGDAEFDDTYRIDHATDERVAAFLTGEVRTLLKKLEPFALFRMTHQDYHCLKHVPDLNHYPPQHAINDLDTLIQIAELAGPADDL